ncbi:MAG: gamma-glutamyl-gamma-aminobutyrate hydrolase family protein [Eubacteriales bacterium]|nr:gamma-glutamyl-gamma-aminobutyrate hydrolase family protein [Eubacteriales bacterium]
MKAPLIGISGSIKEETGRQDVVRGYLTSVLGGGGIPLLMSVDMNEQQVAECLSRLDGLMLAGGIDVDPALYDEWPLTTLGEVHPLRDQFELSLVKEALRLRMPVFGICRGIQLLNVALGGTLYQDLPTQYQPADGSPCMQHIQTAPPQYASHQVAVKEGSPLRAILGRDRLGVNSYHHEAIKSLSPRLSVCAQAPDGVIEAVYDPELPFLLGVQWHPERMDDASSRAIFGAFVKAATEYAARK